MVVAWVVTIPSAALIGYIMLNLTKLPTVLAWLVIGPILIAFAIWAIWAMRHTIHAADVEAEVPAESELSTHLDPHPKLVGHGPVE